MDLRPIGFVRSKIKESVRRDWRKVVSEIVIDAKLTEALDGLEGFSHIILLYIFHQSHGYTLRVKPFLDDQLRGLFATRYPRRPNPIGLSVVRLLARQETILDIEGVDVLDGTPLLDIKPYVPDFDGSTETRTGWYETRNKRYE